jgi:hypothetical protein
MTHQLPLSHKSQINVSKSSESSLFGLKVEEGTQKYVINLLYCFKRCANNSNKFVTVR